MHPLVVLIVSQPGMAERLLADHTDDGHGHCRVCTCGGPGVRQLWPCTIRNAAETARSALLAAAATRRPAADP